MIPVEQLARKVDPTIWEDPRERLACFALEDGAAGVSVFAYSGREDLVLVAVAIQCGRARGLQWGRKGPARLRAVNFLALPVELVEDLGPVEKTDGTTPIERVNQMHRELQWCPSKLAALVEKAASTPGAQLLEITRAELEAGLRGLKATDLCAEGLAWRDRELARLDENRERANGPR